MRELAADLAVIGGGLGGCAAALTAARLGLSVVLTDERSRLGGQLTSQMVPPDEHPWIETCGGSGQYRALRQAIRQFYRDHLPLTARARADPALNPGNGTVSRLCHDPRVAEAVLGALFAPGRLAGRVRVLLRHAPVAVQVTGDRIDQVVVEESATGDRVAVVAPRVVDATELGELLPRAGVEHVVGAEAQRDTGEPHALAEADPRDQQAFTVCFALEHRPGQDHTIARPAGFDGWRKLRPHPWPGPLLGWSTLNPQTGAPMDWRLLPEEGEPCLWAYRRVLDPVHFQPGAVGGSVTVVNWPQNDYALGPLCGVDGPTAAQHLRHARELSLALLYWLQTEAPRPDGGTGYPGLFLRADLAGETPDGLAEAAYVRESRRIRAEVTVTEQDIAHAARAGGPTLFPDTVGTGCYRIDLHPSASGRGYLDLSCWAFQIPLGALLPVRVENLIAGGKNLGVTHIANGAFRVHPVEWSVGEAAGALAALSLRRGVPPRAVRRRSALLDEFQALLRRLGAALEWKEQRFV